MDQSLGSQYKKTTGRCSSQTVRKDKALSPQEVDGRTESSLSYHRPMASALGCRAGRVRLVFPSSLSRLGLILLLLQYSTEALFHMARLFHFADENNERL